MIKVAVDPGGTTGIAIRVHDGTLFTFTTDTPEDLWRVVLDNKPDVLIIEWWSYFKGTVTPAGEYTAGLCHSLEGVYFTLGKRPYKHLPKERLSPIDYTKIAKLQLKKLYQRDFVIHEVDALSHLLLWEARHGSN